MAKEKATLQKDCNAEKRRPIPSQAQKERKAANSKASSSQNAGCKSADNRIVKKRRRRLLAPQQEEVWEHIDPLEQRELEHMMDKNWSWRYKIRQGASWTFSLSLSVSTTLSLSSLLESLYVVVEPNSLCFSRWQ